MREKGPSHHHIRNTFSVGVVLLAGGWALKASDGIEVAREAWISIGQQWTSLGNMRENDSLASGKAIMIGSEASNCVDGIGGITRVYVDPRNSEPAVVFVKAVGEQVVNPTSIAACIENGTHENVKVIQVQQ